MVNAFDKMRILLDFVTDVVYAANDSTSELIAGEECLKIDPLIARA